MLNCVKDKYTFSYFDVLRKFDVPKESCLHVGANFGSEIGVYDKYGFENVIWIEGYKPYFEVLKENIKHKDNQFAFNIMVSDIQDEKVEFNVASNYGSSTMFQPTKSWHDTFSNISFNNSEKIKCSRLDTLLYAEFDKDFLNSIKFLVLDIEGAELKALKSMGSLLDSVEFAFVEVSLRPNFYNAPLMLDIDKFFIQHSFKKVYLKFGSASGDALYKKVSNLPLIDVYVTLFMDRVLQTISIFRITDQITRIKYLIKKLL